MVSTNNRKTGNSFERQLCIILSSHGYWAHNLAQNSAGQPFDVFAARNGKSHPIDCKVCERDVFQLSRIEENQLSAMTLWFETGNGEGWFALRLSSGEIRMIPFSTLQRLLYVQSALGKREIQTLGLTLEGWVAQCE